MNLFSPVESVKNPVTDVNKPSMYNEELSTCTIVILFSAFDLLWGPSLFWPAAFYMLSWVLIFFIGIWVTLFPDIEGGGDRSVPFRHRWGFVIGYNVALSLLVSAVSLFVSANASIWTPGKETPESAARSLTLEGIHFPKEPIDKNKPPYRLRAVIERALWTLSVVITIVVLQLNFWQDHPYSAFGALVVAGLSFLLGLVDLWVVQRGDRDAPKTYTILGLLTSVTSAIQLVGYIVAFYIEKTERGHEHKHTWWVSEPAFATYFYAVHFVFLMACPIFWQWAAGRDLRDLLTSVVWVGYDPLMTRKTEKELRATIEALDYDRAQLLGRLGEVEGETEF